MIPFADMVNHDFNHVASWAFSDELRQGQIYAVRPIKKGSEVTISYGNKSNRLLLRTYGFALPNNPNLEATVYIQLPDGEIKNGEPTFVS